MTLSLCKATTLVVCILSVPVPVPVPVPLARSLSKHKVFAVEALNKQ